MADNDNQTLKFKKYGSIENTSNKLFINSVYASYPNMGKLVCVVTEKAHGAHFSLQTNGTLVRAGKRRSELTDEDKFHNHSQMVTDYTTQMYALFKSVTKLISDKTIDTVQIDGELIGGSYDHPDVPKGKGVSRVQKGVNYCPDYRFYVYDIKYCTIDNPDKWVFLDYDICLDLFQECGFSLYAKPLKIGPFEEVVNYDPLFQTLIPGQLGYPEIDNNYAEGVVIKPMQSINLPTGSRVIFKSKNDKFCETQKSKKTWKNISLPEVKEEIREIQSQMLDMVTENRLASVISKEGEFTSMKQIGKFIGLLSRDVLEEYEREFGHTFNDIDKPSQKLVTKALAGKCKAVVFNYLDSL